jgi:hypothetical protein
MLMPFGKYKGCQIEMIPEEYLEWLWDNVDLYGPLQDEVGNLVEGGHIPSVPEVYRESIQAVYHRMARKWHPDAGGTHEAMQAINEFYEELQST